MAELGLLAWWIISLALEKERDAQTEEKRDKKIKEECSTTATGSNCVQLTIWRNRGTEQ